MPGGQRCECGKLNLRSWHQGTVTDVLGRDTARDWHRAVQGTALLVMCHDNSVWPDLLLCAMPLKELFQHAGSPAPRMAGWPGLRHRDSNCTVPPPDPNSHRPQAVAHGRELGPPRPSIPREMHVCMPVHTQAGAHTLARYTVLRRQFLPCTLAGQGRLAAHSRQLRSPRIRTDAGGHANTLIRIQ